MADKDDKIHNKNPDQTLWETYTQNIKPLQNKKEINFQDPAPQSQTPHKRKSDPAPRPQRPKTENSPVRQNTDRRTQEKLRRGQFKIEARLDLHGKTREQAYDALHDFILASFEGRKKCVLVITGKGGWQSADELLIDKKPGILRQTLPEWLSDPALSPYVLSWQHAKPKDGGEGAFYVLLRRKK
ncbi:MAG: Smr/MutS family protein [Alphaproteobacteria bacterium]|nr:Smr/MutS family protein [Alphaproteobacteria bacterium]